MTRSIKTQLSLALMAFAALFMIFGGWLVYNQIRASFYREFDERLRLQALSLTSGIRKERDYVNVIFSDRYLREFTQESSTWFFQLWAPEPLDRKDLPNTFKSNSLTRNQDLPRECGSLDNPVYINFQLPNGKPGRGIGITFTPIKDWSIRRDDRVKSVDVDMFMAQDRTQLDTSLRAVAKHLIIAGGIGLFSTIILVPPLLTRLLRPLKLVSRQTEAINADTLHERFNPNQPEEIRPIILALNGLLERLEISFVRERRFVSDIAHELRTPIAEIKTFTELKIKWPDKTEGDFEKEILKMIRRMESLVSNLLQLARMESTPSDTLQSQVEIQQEVENCLGQLTQIIESRNISIKKQIEQNSSLLTHPDILHTIVFNLLSNAVYHSPEGSSLKIQSSATPFNLCVTNPAPNLKQEDLPLMFDRLWRQEKSRSSTERHGLGLSLAQTCAEALGMKISAQLDQENRLSMTLQLMGDE